MFLKFSRKKNLFFWIACFFSIGLGTHIDAQNVSISGVRVWESDREEFSAPKDLVIQSGKLSAMRDSRANSLNPLYALPGFCDSYTTLGVNPWGGEASPDSLKIGLQGFLSSGFTLIESVGDGDWIQKVQELVSKGQWKGPRILKSRPPLVPYPGFNLSPKLYQSVRTDEEMKNFLSQNTTSKTHIFHRNLGSYVPDLRFLYSLRTNKSKSSPWILHTFADPLSSREALGSEFQVIFHPIAFKAPQFQMEKILWAPLMGIYYYQSKRNEKEWGEERLKALDRSAFFRISYEEISKSPGDILSEGEIFEASKNYMEYESQFRDRFYMKGRLIFATGTGNPLVYPGLGGLKESEIWENAMASWSLKEETVIEEVSIQERPGLMERVLRRVGWGTVTRDVRTPTREPNKIPRHRKLLLKALTEDTCRFMGSSYSGRIQEGGESHLLFYDGNPLHSKGGIHRPISVYIQGRHSFGKKL